jgi:carbon-monoxide dehydrogenase medium subunit
VETAVVGSRGDTAFQEAVVSCRDIDAMEDVHASSVYRRHLAEVLTQRALEAAFTRADGKSAT